MVTILNIPRDSPQPPALAARIALRPSSKRRGVLNGAWWPRSRDLDVELPGLVEVLDIAWGRIHRVTVNVRMWPRIPRGIRCGSHTVRVGWFDAEQDPNVLCLISHNEAPYRWDLLVVPPETSPAAAARLMDAASDVHDQRSASELTASATDAPAPQQPAISRLHRVDEFAAGVDGVLGHACSPR
jgi:hypothetical protein